MLAFKLPKIKKVLRPSWKDSKEEAVLNSREENDTTWVPSMRRPYYLTTIPLTSADGSMVEGFSENPLRVGHGVAYGYSWQINQNLAKALLATTTTWSCCSRSTPKLWVKIPLAGGLKGRVP